MPRRAAAVCAGAGVKAGVKDTGGATPYFGAVLAPAPLGAASDLGVAPPVLGPMYSAHAVPPWNDDGSAPSITTATPLVSRSYLVASKRASPRH